MPSTRKKGLKAQVDDDSNDAEDVNVGSEKTRPTSKPVSQWMFLINEEAVQCDGNTDNQPVISSLRHPKTDKKALFLFSHEDRNVYEVTQHKEECRSWFIGETVHRDGSIYMTTPVDPLFLVLPYLIKSAQSGKFMPLDQIIMDEEYPDSRRLHTACESCDMQHVAEVKGDADLQAYRYDLDKTMSWLKVKAERVSAALSTRNVYVTGSKSADLVCSKASEDEYMRFAFGIVSDYLPSELSTQLRDHLGIPAVVEKRPSDATQPPSKRVKLEDITPAEDYSKNVKLEQKTDKGKQSVAQKKLGQVDKKGMKSMMSFFSPKSKS